MLTHSLVVHVDVVPVSTQQSPHVHVSPVLVDGELDRSTQQAAHEARVPLVGVDPVNDDGNTVASKTFAERSQTATKQALCAFSLTATHWLLR